MTSIWRKFKLSFVNSMIDAWKKNTGITRLQGAGSEYICDLCYTDHRRNREISAWDLFVELLMEQKLLQTLISTRIN